MKSEIRFQNEQPFHFFFSQHAGRSVKEYCISSPFLGQSTIETLLDFLKRKQTRVRLLVNLSPLNMATSISNPLEPLVLLTDKLGDRIQIRSNGNLHAKAILSDTAGLFGSSNFTSGGEERNRELNLYICGSENRARTLISSLRGEFELNWLAGDPVNIEEKSKTWEDYYRKIANSVSRFIPNPNLGKDNYRKIRLTMRRSAWDVDKLGVELTEGEKAKAGGYIPKIIFMEQLGLVKFDGKTVTRVDEVWEQVKDDPAKIFALVVRKFKIFQEVLVTISKRDETKYADLMNVFNLDEKSSSLVAAIRWLESLDYIDRQQKNLGSDKHHKFKLKSKGQQYLSNIGLG